MGNTNNVRTVAVTSPPMMATASGFWLSDPIPDDNAAGNKPSIAISAVITTGRIRDITPSRIAMARSMRCLRF